MVGCAIFAVVMVIMYVMAAVGSLKCISLAVFQNDPFSKPFYAPVICIPGSLGAGDTGDIAGLKCRNLTSDVSRQCRGSAGVLISR